MAEQFSLAWLLGDDIDVATFKNEYWEEQPLYLQGHGVQRFQDILSVRDIDEIICLTSGANRNDVRLVQADDAGLSVDSHAISRDSRGRPNVHQIYTAFTKGDTVVLNELQNRVAAIASLAKGVSQDLQHATGANAYLSPKNGQGFMPHFDTHDVFVLQTEGSKKWSVYGRYRDFPQCSDKTRIAADSLGKPVCSYTMKGGDLLYIPRGFVHEANTVGSVSLHITLGVHSLCWSDLIAEVIESATEADPKLRRALPTTFLTADSAELVNRAMELIKSVDWTRHVESGVANLRRTTVDKSRVSPDGHFEALGQVDVIEADTRLKRRPGVTCITEDDRESSSILFDGNRVRGPATLLPAFRFIAEAQEFRPRDLPGGLSGRSRLTICKRLVKDGLLTMRNIDI